MYKKEILRDGTEITIRNITMDDLENYMKFFRSLPPKDRKYLRINVTNDNLIKERIKQIRSGNFFRIVALKDDQIIASGALELYVDDWHKHHAELRVIVSGPFQRRGLGLIMNRELYLIAAQHDVKKVIAKMMKPQTGAVKILKKLGFKEEHLIPKYVQDQDETAQDLVIMTCDMNDFWKELESLYHSTDWKRCR
ncbi:MAG: GNAT family N-acetyltransferase [Candidatus Aminicenantes bacterium]|nr:GNAT family N-acetyltransferase [Candidatus Aminicenantes bacterium]